MRWRQALAPSRLRKLQVTSTRMVCVLSLTGSQPVRNTLPCVSLLREEKKRLTRRHSWRSSRACQCSSVRRLRLALRRRLLGLWRSASVATSSPGSAADGLAAWPSAASSGARSSGRSSVFLGSHTRSDTASVNRLTRAVLSRGAPKRAASVASPSPPASEPPLGA